MGPRPRIHARGAGPASSNTAAFVFVGVSGLLLVGAVAFAFLPDEPHPVRIAKTRKTAAKQDLAGGPRSPWQSREQTARKPDPARNYSQQQEIGEQEISSHTTTTPARSPDLEVLAYQQALTASKAAGNYDGKVKPILDYLGKYHPNGRHVAEAKELLSNLNRMSYFAQAWGKAEAHYQDVRLAPVKKGQARYLGLRSLKEVDGALASGIPKEDRAVVRVVEAAYAMTSSPPEYRRSLAALDDARRIYDSLRVAYMRRISYAMQALCLYNLQVVAFMRMRCEAFRAMTNGEFGLVDAGVIRSELGLLKSMIEAVGSITDDTNDADHAEWERTKKPLLMAIATLHDALLPLASEK